MAWARQTGHAAHLYVLGYRRAAEHVQAEVTRTGSEALVFPLLFLWRQHIELYVKYLIELARTVHDVDGASPHGHKLPDLWLTLRRLLELEDLGDEVRNAVRVTEQVLNDLEAVDPNSTHSRYAEGQMSNFLIASLAQMPDHFDPTHFGSVLARASDFLECVHAEYANRLEVMAEVLAAAM